MTDLNAPFDLSKLQRQLDNEIPPDDWMAKFRWCYQMLTGCEWTPVKRRCKPCDGSGYVGSFGAVCGEVYDTCDYCPDCNGSGFITDKPECPKCHDTGRSCFATSDGESVKEFACPEGCDSQVPVVSALALLDEAQVVQRKLEAENSKLRAALQWIANEPWEGDTLEFIESLRGAALDALFDPPEDSQRTTAP